MAYLSVAAACIAGLMVQAGMPAVWDSADALFRRVDGSRHSIFKYLALQALASAMTVAPDHIVGTWNHSPGF